MKLALCAKGLIAAADNRPTSDEEEDEEEPLDDSAEEDLRNPSVADEVGDPPPLNPAATPSFEQQKELLQMQLDDSRIRHRLRLERLHFSEEDEHARRCTRGAVCLPPCR